MLYNIDNSTSCTLLSVVKRSRLFQGFKSARNRSTANIVRVVIDTTIVVLDVLAVANVRHNTAPSVPPGSLKVRRMANGMKQISEIKSAADTNASRIFVVDRMFRFFNTAETTSEFPVMPINTSTK